ncbi:hypothetical protein [Mangrovimonas sp. YM274]|uniref:hypothetical protein n=1 Tax=Mangrovimonas sp. YM274 TaxID=3070660 RepID=UPI0027DB7B9F|nr:hypothetical protein [Mangrovimonas sp. YM274]WMI69999.1 hypothetical protein RBH95_06520 [Mangrovimonas sp. YM274]
MRFLILCLAFVCFNSVASAQKGPAILILKDSTRISGEAEISGIHSIVTVKFKNDTLKWKGYKSKDLIGVDILENNYFRKFRYKHVDGSKFEDIVEIVSIDSLSLYVRVYEGSFIDNNGNNRLISFDDSEPKGLDFINPFSNYKINYNLRLPNGNLVPIGQNTCGLVVNFPRYSYYVGHGNSDQIETLYTRGLPFSKSFKRSMKNYFNDCPELLEKVENEEFTKKNISEILSFYNCNYLQSCIQ